MTEQEWRESLTQKPGVRESLLQFLQENASRRKFLLLAAASRRSWRNFDHYPQASRLKAEIVELIEQQADGNLSEFEREKAYQQRLPFLEQMATEENWVNGCDWQDVFEPLQRWDLAEYHVVVRCVLGVAGNVLEEIFGNPFRPVNICSSWLTPTVVSLAQAIYDERAFDRMPILADALEEAGCTNAAILNHCRQPGEHVRGCWVIDLLLRKE